MTHENQHWAPRRYQEVWDDPSNPRKPKKTVWVFPKNGQEGKPESPKTNFTIKDLYTIQTSQGERDLSYEEWLKKLEDNFGTIRNNFLEKQIDLPLKQRLQLMAFVTAFLFRTPVIRDLHQKPLKEVLQLMENLKNRPSSPPLGRSSDSPVFVEEDIKKWVDNPVQYTFSFFEPIFHMLSFMAIKVLCTNDEPGFITSDAPVVLFEPRAHAIYGINMMSPDLEITFPISPRRFLLLHHAENFMDPIQYLPVNKEIVSSCNRATHLGCDKEFVVMQNYADPAWY